MPPTKTKESVTSVMLPAPNIKVLKVEVKGISPLIVHKWSAKQQKQIADKQAKKAHKAREVRDPEQEMYDALYVIKDGKAPVYGFPASAFKHAMIAAARYVDVKGFSMTYAKGAFFVMGDILPIKGSKPEMRTDMVRVPPGRGGADIRYRPEFKNWAIDLLIQYNANVITDEQVLNLLSIAGFSIGVGEQRPSAPIKPGNNGMFEIVRN